MPAHPEITLGEHTLPCYPQRHAYLANRLGRFVETLADNAGEIESAGDVAGLLGDSAYDVLCALIPNLGKRMSRHEFAGYGSEAQMEAGDYDEREDHSPTFPEIVHALETAVAVNRFDVLKVVGRVIDPKLLKAEISLKVSEMISGGLQSSPSPNGASAPSGSGTTEPTLEVSTSPETTVTAGSGEPLTTSA